MMSRISCLAIRAAILISIATTCRAQSGTVTRVLQTDPTVTYSGTWYTNNSASNIDSLVALTNDKGAMAAITFTGTGITWIGVQDPYSGIAWIYLDGTFTTVDCYSAATLYQQPIYAIHNLAPGQHTLSIEVPHIRDGQTQGSWVWINAFDIENGSAVMNGTSASAGRVEENNPAVSTTGSWSVENSTVLSGGSAFLSDQAGSTATLNFNGTSVIWISYRDQWSGIAKVYLDGALQATVDNYQPVAQAQYPAWSASGLAPGPHSVMVQVTGTNNVSSSGPGVWVDAFQIVLSPVSAGSPTLNAGAMVSAASFMPGPNNQVTPGQIVSIFGSNLLGSNVPASGPAVASGLPLPRQLGPSNTAVNACGSDIPLFSAFPGQINAQLPWECPATGSTPIAVTVGGQTTASQTVNLAPAAPGIFTINSTGTGDGVILHADNSLVSSASPAKGQEQIMIFCTGLGPTNPSFATGSAATGANTTASPVMVTIGGQNATVVQSGLAAGFVGLYQVNAIVPSGLSGSQSVLITVGSATVSRTGVTVSVTP
jgi:uncharacterized protein (TIGR03437 family)